MATAGQPIRAADFPAAVSADSGIDETGFTNTSYGPGATPVGVVFVAPTSGRVEVNWHARFESNIANLLVYVSVAVRSGGILGSGGSVSGASDTSSLQPPTDGTAGSNQRLSAGMSRTVTGLTPGATYNAQVEFRMAAAGNGDIFDRSITVSPLP